MKKLLYLILCFILSLSLFACEKPEDKVEGPDEGAGDNINQLEPIEEPSDEEKLNLMLAGIKEPIKAENTPNISLDDVFEKLDTRSFSLENITIDGESKANSVIFKDNILYISDGTGTATQIVGVFEHGILTVNEADGAVTSSMLPFAQIIDNTANELDIEKLLDAFTFKKGDLQKTDREHVYTVNKSFMIRVAKAFSGNDDITLDAPPKITLDMTEYDASGSVSISVIADDETAFNATLSSTEKDGARITSVTASSDGTDLSLTVRSVGSQLLGIELDLISEEDEKLTVVALTVELADGISASAEATVKENGEITTHLLASINETTADDLKVYTASFSVSAMSENTPVDAIASLTISLDATDEISSFNCELSAESDGETILSAYAAYDAEAFKSGNKSFVKLELEFTDENSEAVELYAEATTLKYSENNTECSLSLTYSAESDSGTGSASIYFPAKSSPNVSKNANLYLQNGANILKNYPTYLEKAESLNAQMNAILSSGNFGNLSANHVTYDKATGIYFITSISANAGGYYATTYSSPDAFRYAYAYTQNLGGFASVAQSKAESEARRLVQLIEKDKPLDDGVLVGGFSTYTYIEEYDVYLMIEGTDPTSATVYLNEPDPEYLYNGTKLHRLAYDENGNVSIHSFVTSVDDDCRVRYTCSYCGAYSISSDTEHSYSADVSKTNDSGAVEWHFTNCERCRVCKLEIYNTGGSAVIVTFEAMSESVLNDIRNHKGFENYSLQYDGNDLVIDNIKILNDKESPETGISIVIPRLSDFCAYNVIGAVGGAWDPWCSTLASITLPEGMIFINRTAFSGTHFITKLTLPSTLELIGNSAFSDCTKLSEVIIGNSVKTIGESAFGGCESLSLLYTVGTEGSVGTFVLPEGVSHIGNAAFLETLVQSITLPSSITEVSPQLFQECGKLESVKLGAGVTKISAYAFYKCENLSDITLTESITEIGDFAFYGCSSITDAAISGCTGLESIGARAFYSCTGLKNVTVPGRVTMSDSAFWGCSLDSIRFECIFTSKASLMGLYAKCVTYAGDISSDDILFGETTNINRTALPDSEQPRKIPENSIVNFAGTEDELKSSGYYYDDSVTINCGVTFD